MKFLNRVIGIKLCLFDKTRCLQSRSSYKMGHHTDLMLNVGCALPDNTVKRFIKSNYKVTRHLLEQSKICANKHCLS